MQIRIIIINVLFAKEDLMSFLKKLFVPSIHPKKETAAIFAVEIMGKEDEVIIFHHGVRYLLAVDKKGALVLQK